MAASLGLAVAFAVVVVSGRPVARIPGADPPSLVALLILPALRDGAPLAAFVASSVILYAVIYLAHGVSLRPRGAARYVGCRAPRRRTVLGRNRVTRLHRTSRRGERRGRTYLGNVSITGLLLAGFTSVRPSACSTTSPSQASTAFEPRREGASRRVAPSARCEWDVTTSPHRLPLVLAYAGSALRCCCCSASPTRWETC